MLEELAPGRSLREDGVAAEGALRSGTRADRSCVVRFEGMGDVPSEGNTETRTHDDAGIDLTQIDMMLSMTPRQRLETLYHTASSLARLMPDVEAD